MFDGRYLNICGTKRCVHLCKMCLISMEIFEMKSACAFVRFKVLGMAAACSCPDSQAKISAFFMSMVGSFVNLRGQKTPLERLVSKEVEL